jgi:hypothetical protein
MNRDEASGGWMKGEKELTRLSFKHVPENLNVRRNLFLGPRHTCLLEILNQIGIPPPATAAGEGGPR